MWWSSLLATTIGGLLVISANFVTARQQARAAEASARREVARQLREEKRAAAQLFFEAARRMEGHAVRAWEAQGQVVTIPEADWEAFFNTHVALDLLVEPGTRERLQSFLDRLRRATRNDNGLEEVWSYLQDSRRALRDALRAELREVMEVERPERRALG